MDDLDAIRFEDFGGADAGELQELRRVDGAARKDDLAPGARFVHLAVLTILNADGTLAVEQDASGERIGFDPEIGTPPRRPQISARRRHAQAAFGGDLIETDAFDAGAIEV